MSDEAVGPTLNHALSLLDTDIDRKKFSKMHDRANPQPKTLEEVGKEIRGDQRADPTVAEYRHGETA
jgi:hypothetical protein